MRYFKYLITLICICAFFSTINSYAFEQDSYPFTATADAQRFYDLTNEIRCVVCQNQNIADSNAPLAKDLREKVYTMVVAQKSSEEIKNYLVKRYGEFILLQPRLNKLSVFLWLFPFVGISLILLFIFRFVRRQQALAK